MNLAQIFKMLCIAVFAVLMGCSTMSVDEATKLIADEQVSTGELLMPTQENPVAHGYEGILMLYVANADNGAATKALGHYGVCTETPCQWDPEVNEGRPYGMYTAPDGQMAFLVQFQYPNQGRGNAAEPGSEMVDWENEVANAQGEGEADGWYELPTEGDYITTVTDCGQMHPNYYFGWSTDGDMNLPEDPSALGEPYCGDY